MTRLDPLWSGLATGLAIFVVAGGVIAYSDLRAQAYDHSYAVGYDEGRSMHDDSCRHLVEIRWPRRFVPETDMGAWLDGCLKAADDIPSPPPDLSTVGPEGPR